MSAPTAPLRVPVCPAWCEEPEGHDLDQFWEGDGWGRNHRLVVGRVSDDEFNPFIVEVLQTESFDDEGPIEYSPILTHLGGSPNNTLSDESALVLADLLREAVVRAAALR